MIDFKKKEFRYYDSLGLGCIGNGWGCLMALAHYLGDESLDKKQEIFPLLKWKFICVTKVKTSQHNTYSDTNELPFQ